MVILIQRVGSYLEFHNCQQWNGILHYRIKTEQILGEK